MKFEFSSKSCPDKVLSWCFLDTKKPSKSSKHLCPFHSKSFDRSGASKRPTHQTLKADEMSSTGPIVGNNVVVFPVRKHFFVPSRTRPSEASALLSEAVALLVEVRLLLSNPPARFAWLLCQATTTYSMVSNVILM